MWGDEIGRLKIVARGASSLLRRSTNVRSWRPFQRPRSQGTCLNASGRSGHQPECCVTQRR